jgi:hypothetical protein
LKDRLNNNVKFESLDNYHLVFVYLNFNLSLQHRNKILSKLSNYE